MKGWVLVLPPHFSLWMAFSSEVRSLLSLRQILMYLSYFLCDWGFGHKTKVVENWRNHKNFYSILWVITMRFFICRIEKSVEHALRMWLQ